MNREFIMPSETSQSVYVTRELLNKYIDESGRVRLPIEGSRAYVMCEGPRVYYRGPIGEFISAGDVVLNVTVPADSSGMEKVLQLFNPKTEVAETSAVAPQQQTNSFQRLAASVLSMLS